MQLVRLTERLGAQMLTRTDRASPKDRSSSKRKRDESSDDEESLREFLKDNASRYRSAADLVRQCNNGCSWSDADWVCELGVELEEACRGTKYFDQSWLDSASRVLEQCNQGSSWADAYWVAEDFVEKFLSIATDGLL